MFALEFGSSELLETVPIVELLRVITIFSVKVKKSVSKNVEAFVFL